MRLSSNVIKQVSRKLEHFSIYPNTGSMTEEKLPAAELFGPGAVDIYDEAEQIIAKARFEAESILREASGQAEAIRQEAYTQGQRQGAEEAARLGQADRAEFYAAAGKILQELAVIKENIYGDMEKELVALAIAMAEKMVSRQLDISPETIVDITAAALNQARDCKQVILYIPAGQAQIIKSRQEEIGAVLYQAEHFSIVADAKIEPGGCRIETEKGYIDACRETMLDKLNKIAGGN